MRLSLSSDLRVTFGINTCHSCTLFWHRLGLGWTHSGLRERQRNLEPFAVNAHVRQKKWLRVISDWEIWSRRAASANRSWDPQISASRSIMIWSAIRLSFIYHICVQKVHWIIRTDQMVELVHVMCAMQGRQGCLILGWMWPNKRVQRKDRRDTIDWVSGVHRESGKKEGKPTERKQCQNRRWLERIEEQSQLVTATRWDKLNAIEKVNKRSAGQKNLDARQKKKRKGRKKIATKIRHRQTDNKK